MLPPAMGPVQVLVQVLHFLKWMVSFGAACYPAEVGTLTVRVLLTDTCMLPHALLHSILLAAEGTKECLPRLRSTSTMLGLVVLL